MKKLLSGTLICLSVLLTTSGVLGQVKKYEIKSGIVAFEIKTDFGTMVKVDKAIVYFDDYGMKECKETYTGDKVSHIMMSDGKIEYAIHPSQKKAEKRGPAYRGTEMKFDWNEVSQKDKDAGKAKKLPNVTIAGKNCESFEVTISGRTVFAGWKNICFLTDVESMGVHVTIKALRIDENVKVPADKFQIPAGYTIQ